MAVSIEEQETTMNVFPKASGIPCEIYSCIPTEVAKIKKYAEKYPDELTIIKEDDIGIFATAPAKWFRFAPPIKRNYSEEQKQALRERAKVAREKKRENDKIG